MNRWLLIILLFMPLTAHAESSGMHGLMAIKSCIMANDSRLCHSFMTQSSYEIFDKFTFYKLMPCLPTNFVYESEQALGEQIIVKASMPADNKTNYIFRMVFVGKGEGIKLDLPETLHTGLGGNWRDKMNFAEQLFLMMRQNMQDKLTCDVIRDLARPPAKGK